MIPARFDSERFPGKPLARVGGKSLVRLTYEAAESAKCVDHCCVATDDDRVIDAVKSFNGRVVRTPRDCADGFERCAHAYRLLVAGRAAASGGRLRSADFDVVVKVECDEAFIRAHHIETVADLVINTDAVVATLVRVSRGPEVRRGAGVAAGAVTSVFARLRPNAHHAASESDADDATIGAFAAAVSAWTHSPGVYFFSPSTDESRPSSSSQDDENPDTVKCAMDADGYVTGFTRGAPPPGGMVKVGVTAYRSSFLTRENRTRGGRKATRGGGGATKRAEVVDEDAALAAGHRVLAKQVTEPHLGGLKTQASVDKKNAGIAVGDIRLGGLL